LDISVSIFEGFHRKMSQVSTSNTQTSVENVRSSSPATSDVGAEEEGDELAVVDIEDMVVMMVQKYELIYSLRHRDHMNKQKKELAWQEIGEKIGITGKKNPNSTVFVGVVC
jgi:hypothetical protein